LRPSSHFAHSKKQQVDERGRHRNARESKRRRQLFAPCKYLSSCSSSSTFAATMPGKSCRSYPAHPRSRTLARLRCVCRLFDETIMGYSFLRESWEDAQVVAPHGDWRRTGHTNIEGLDSPPLFNPQPHTIPLHKHLGTVLYMLFDEKRQRTLVLSVYNQKSYTLIITSLPTSSLDGRLELASYLPEPSVWRTDCHQHARFEGGWQISRTLLESATHTALLFSPKPYMFQHGNTLYFNYRCMNNTNDFVVCTPPPPLSSLLQYPILISLFPIKGRNGVLPGRRVRREICGAQPEYFLRNRLPIHGHPK